MIFLVLGLVIWCLAHFAKRIFQPLRAQLDERLGLHGGKGVIAGLLALSLLLMVLGYRGSDYVAVYTPPLWAVHVNNLLMLGAVALMGMGQSKGRARAWLRHPMLTGVIVWAIAHLLVNGDLASVLLFGGLAGWAVAEMILINRAEPVWQRPEPGPASGDLRLLLITLVVFAVISGVHMLVGPSPFPG